MAAPRGRLLQLLCARVRHASAPAQAQTLCVFARAAATGAGVSPAAAAASAIEEGIAAAAAANDNSGGSGHGASPPPPRPPLPPPPTAASADAAAAAWLYRRFRQRGGADLTFDVVQFFPDGTALEHHRPLTPAELELHPRDVGLFAPSPRLAAPQRATIAVHDAKILFRTEAARAIITADRAVLFKSSRRRGESGRMARAVLSALQAAPASAGTAAGVAAAFPSSSSSPPPVPPQLPFALVAQSAGAAQAAAAARAAAAHAAAAQALPQLPFELRVLEVLLDATADYFYRKAQHLNWMLEAVGGDEGAPTAAASSPLSSSPAAAAPSSSPFSTWAGAGAGAGGAGLGLNDDAAGGEAGPNLASGSPSSSALGTGPMAVLARAEPFAAMHKAHQLVPVQRFLTGVKADVQETAKAIEALIEDPGSLEELCLTHVRRQQQAPLAGAGALGEGPASSSPPTPLGGGEGAAAAAAGGGALSLDVKLASNMLESYLREIQSIEGALKETEENLENTRCVLWPICERKGKGDGRGRTGRKSPPWRQPQKTKNAPKQKNLKKKQARLADRPRRQPQPHHPGQHVALARVHLGHGRHARARCPGDEPGERPGL